MMGMRNSDATFLRREIEPILERAAHLSPEAGDALGQLRERIEHADEAQDLNALYGVKFLLIGGSLHEVLVDEHMLPYITAHITEDGQVDLSLDQRFGLTEANQETARKWLWFMAQAMAVAAGRTSHGENSYVRNPHGRSGAGDPPDMPGGDPPRLCQCGHLQVRHDDETAACHCGCPEFAAA